MITPVRCAIYTRKSHDERADAQLGSTERQRELCEAYIASQAGSGWTITPEKFDDPGFSGGTTNRPALQRLLTLSDAGEVDIVVIYKLDRLSRSMADYMVLLERFKRSRTQFVSITEHFSFTRLRILNMLPEEACAPSVVEAIGDVRTGKDAIRVIELLVSKGVCRHALGRAITSVSDRQQLARLWERWVAQCRLPVPPVAAVVGYRPVETADDLRRLARRYRNSAARYIPDALDGLSAFAEFFPSEGSRGIVVHLRHRPDGWEIDGLFGKHNVRPSPEDRQRARDFLYAAGIQRREQVKQPEGEWGSLRRLTSRMIWDLDED